MEHLRTHLEHRRAGAQSYLGDIVEHFGTFWNILEHFGTLWNISEHFGTFWNILEHFGTYLEHGRAGAQSYAGDIVEHFGTF